MDQNLVAKYASFSYYHHDCQNYNDPSSLQINLYIVVRNTYSILIGNYVYFLISTVLGLRGVFL